VSEFSYPEVNVIVSDQGFRIQAHGRYGLRYWENDAEVKLVSETLASPALWVNPNGMSRADGQPLSAEESERVLENIRRACAWKGWKLDTGPGMSQDEVFEQFVLNSPKAHLSPDSVLLFARRYLDPALLPLDYESAPVEQGKDADGWWAIGRYERPGRAIELHCRDDLRSVRYIIGKDAIDHRDWITRLGVDAAYPMTTNDLRLRLAALAEDLQGPCAPLIRGEQDEEFHRCAKQLRGQQAKERRRWWNR
jgi:hypothetical protein